MGGIWSKVLVNLYLRMPLVAIPATLLREMEGHAIFSDWWGATPWSGIAGRFDWLFPPCQLITSRFWLGVGAGVGGGVVCHVFVSRLRVPRVPWDFRLLVESVVFPTEHPPVAQGGAAILVTGGWAAHNLDFQALRTPCLCKESGLCT